MKVLMALKLSSDSLMTAEATACKNAFHVEKLHLLTDKRYGSEIRGVNYHYLKSWVAGIPALRVLARIPMIFSICKNENIDLIITYHLTSYGIVGLIASRLLKIPMSLHFLGKDLDDLCQKPILGNILLKVASMIDIITVQGSKSKKFLESKGLKTIHIIPTACNISKFNFNDVKKIYHLIFLGRLGREKRIDRFIEIVDVIQKKNFPIKAVIVGTGPEEKKALEKIEKKNLRDCINYVGWSNNVMSYLSQSKIFVLTSDSDQLPSSLLEAMATGLVPVVADVGNISDVVNENNGYIIDKENISEFVEAILNLLNDEELFINKSKAAHEKVKEFTIEANSKRWESIFNRWEFK